jgi:hypothetical protein
MIECICMEFSAHASRHLSYIYKIVWRAKLSSASIGWASGRPPAQYEVHTVSIRISSQYCMHGIIIYHMDRLQASCTHKDRISGRT